MKILTLLSLLMMTQMSFAKQVQTDCPMMSESNSRRNPKSEMNKGKSISKSTTKSKIVSR